MSDESSKDERRRLEWENRGCICGGNGLVIVYHAKWSGGRIGTRKELNFNGDLVDVSFPAEVAAHCDCAVGRWMRDRTDPELQRRIPRVEDIKTGRSRWLLKPPSLNVGEVEDLEDETHPIPTRRDINAMFPRIA